MKVGTLNGRFRTVWDYLHLGTSAWLVVAAIVQAGTFALLARWLTLHDFGVYMALQAGVQILVEVVSLGTGHAYVRRVSRSPEDHAASLGHALLVPSLAFLPLAAISLLLFHSLLSIPITGALICYFASETIGGRLSALSEHACVANQNVLRANHARLIMVVGRLVVLLGYLVLIRHADLESWLVVQGASSLVLGIVSIGGLVIRQYGRPAAIVLKQDLGFGLASLMLQFSAVLLANVDRLILAREASMAAVAIYSAATRVTSFGAVPMQGMLRNLILGAFVAGSGGSRTALAYALRNSLRVIALGLLSALGVCVVAPVMPYVFGEAYRPAILYAMALSVLPGLQGVQYLLADALSATDHQFMRAAVACFATTFLIVLLVLLVRHIGLPGMVIGLYCFQIVAIAAFSAALWHLGHREAAKEAGRGQQAQSSAKIAD